MDDKQIVQRFVRVYLLFFILALLCTTTYGAGVDTSLFHLPQHHLILQFHSGEAVLTALDLLVQEPYNQRTTIDLFSCDLAFIAITTHAASPVAIRDPYLLLAGLKQISDDEIRQIETVNMEEFDDISVNDPLFPQQWGLQLQYVPQTWEFANISFSPRSNITVAIIDTGVDFTHPDLVGAYHAASYNWVRGTPHITDTNGHGTHLAGIIAATTENFMGMAGIAPVHILSETVYEEGIGIRASRSAMAIYHAAQVGAEVILLGYGGKKYSDVEAKAISYAKKQGSLIISSAGNDRSNASHYPSDLSDVISVGSLSQAKSLSIFSNYGVFVDFVGPGEGIYGTEPGIKYSKRTGTSQAAAGIAGVAALLWSLDTTLTAEDMYTILIESVEDLGKEGKDIYFGYGYPNSLRAAQLILGNS